MPIPISNKEETLVENQNRRHGTPLSSTNSRSSSQGSGSTTSWSTTHTRTNKLETSTKSPQKTPTSTPRPVSPTATVASLDAHVAAAAATGFSSSFSSSSLLGSKRPSPINVGKSNALPAEELQMCSTPFSMINPHALGKVMGIPTPTSQASGVAPSISNCQAQPPQNAAEVQCMSVAGEFPLFRTVGLLHEAGRNEQGRVDELIALKRQERVDLAKKLATLTPPAATGSTSSSLAANGSDLTLMERCIGQHLETEYGKTSALMARCDVVIGYWERVASDIRMSYCSILREIYHVIGKSIKKAGVSLDAEQQRASEKFLFGFSSRLTHPDGTPVTCPHQSADPNNKPPLSIEDFKKVMETPGLRERLATLAQNATGLHHGLMTFHQGILCPAAPFLHAVPILNEKGEHILVEYRNIKHRPTAPTPTEGSGHSNNHNSSTPLESCNCSEDSEEEEGGVGDKKSSEPTIRSASKRRKSSVGGGGGEHHHHRHSAATAAAAPPPPPLPPTATSSSHRELGYELKLSIPAHFRRFVPGIALTDEEDCQEYTTEASVQAAIDGLSETAEETIMLHALRFILEHSRTIANTVNPLFRKGTARLIHYSMNDLVQSLDHSTSATTSTTASNKPTASPPSSPASALQFAHFMSLDDTQASSSSTTTTPTAASCKAAIRLPTAKGVGRDGEPLPAWATEDLCCYIQILSLSGAEVVSKAKQSFFRSRRKMAIIRYNQRRGFSGCASSSTSSHTPSSSHTAPYPQASSATHKREGSVESSASTAVYNNNNNKVDNQDTGSSGTPTAQPDYSSFSESDFDANDDFSETMKLVARITSSKTPNPEFLKAFYQDITAFQGEFQRLCTVMTQYLIDKRTDSANLLQKVKTSSTTSSPPGSQSNRQPTGVHRRQRLEDIIPAELFAPISNTYFQRIMIRTNRDKVDMLLRVMSSDLGDTIMPCPLSFVISQSLDRYTKLVCTSANMNLSGLSTSDFYRVAASSTRGTLSTATKDEGNGMARAATAASVSTSGTTKPSSLLNGAKVSTTGSQQQQEDAFQLDEGKGLFSSMVQTCEAGSGSSTATPTGTNRPRSMSNSSGDYDSDTGGPTAGFSDGESQLDSDYLAHQHGLISSPLSPSATGIVATSTTLCGEARTPPVCSASTPPFASVPLNDVQPATTTNYDCDLQFDLLNHDFGAENDDDDTTPMGGATRSSPPPPPRVSMNGALGGDLRSFTDAVAANVSSLNSSYNNSNNQSPHRPSPYHAAMAATGLLVPPMRSSTYSPAASSNVGESPTIPAANTSWTSSSYPRRGSSARSMTNSNVIGFERQPNPTSEDYASQVGDEDEDEIFQSQNDPMLEDIYKSLGALDDDDEDDVTATSPASIFNGTDGSEGYPHYQQQSAQQQYALTPEMMPHFIGMGGSSSSTSPYLLTSPQPHYPTSSSIGGVAAHFIPPLQSSVPSMTREQFDHITAAMAATGMILDRKKAPSYEEAMASISSAKKKTSGSNMKKTGSNHGTNNNSTTSSNHVFLSSGSISPSGSVRGGGGSVSAAGGALTPKSAKTTDLLSNMFTAGVDEDLSGGGGVDSDAILNGGGSTTSAVADGESIVGWYEQKLSDNIDGDGDSSRMSDSIASWAREPPRARGGGGATATTESGRTSVAMGSSLTDVGTASRFNGSLSSCGAAGSESSPPTTPKPAQNIDHFHSGGQYSPSNSLAVQQTIVAQTTSPNTTAMSSVTNSGSIPHHHLPVSHPPLPPRPSVVYPQSMYGSQPSAPSSSVLTGVGCGGGGAILRPNKLPGGGLVPPHLRGPVPSPSNTIKSVCTKASLAPSFGRSPMTNPNAVEKSSPTPAATPEYTAATTDTQQLSPIPEAHQQQSSAGGEESFVVTSSTAMPGSSLSSTPTTAATFPHSRQQYPLTPSGNPNSNRGATTSSHQKSSKSTTIRPSTVQGIPNFGAARRSPPPFLENSGSNQPQQQQQQQQQPPVTSQTPMYAQLPPPTSQKRSSISSAAVSGQKPPPTYGGYAPPPPQQQQQQQQFAQSGGGSGGPNMYNRGGGVVQQQPVSYSGDNFYAATPSPLPQGRGGYSPSMPSPPNNLSYYNGSASSTAQLMHVGGYMQQQQQQPSRMMPPPTTTNPVNNNGMMGGLPPPQLYNGGSVTSSFSRQSGGGEGGGASGGGPKPW